MNFALCKRCQLTSSCGYNMLRKYNRIQSGTQILYKFWKGALYRIEKFFRKLTSQIPHKSFSFQNYFVLFKLLKSGWCSKITIIQNVRESVNLKKKSKKYLNWNVYNWTEHYFIFRVFIQKENRFSFLLFLK